MASIYRYDDTTTFSNWTPYQMPDHPPNLPPLERARAALVGCRSYGLHELATPTIKVRARLTVAPRRTIVPRGIVSWVRAGTRRPI